MAEAEIRQDPTSALKRGLRWVERCNRDVVYPACLIRVCVLLPLVGELSVPLNRLHFGMMDSQNMQSECLGHRGLRAGKER